MNNKSLALFFLSMTFVPNLVGMYREFVSNTKAMLKASTQDNTCWITQSELNKLSQSSKGLQDKIVMCHNLDFLGIDLKSLTNLRQLVIQNCKNLTSKAIPKDIPSLNLALVDLHNINFDDCTNLTRLRIYNCKKFTQGFVRRIPKKIRQLDLIGVDLKDKTFDHLTQLEIFSINSCKNFTQNFINTIPKKIHTLSLCPKGIDLNKFSNLKDLKISGCDDLNLTKVLTNNKSVRTLRLYSVDLKDINVDQICVNLENLEIFYCKKFTQGFVRRIPKKIRQLDLIGVDLKDKTFDHLTQLEIFSINSCKNFTQNFIDNNKILKQIRALCLFRADLKNIDLKNIDLSSLAELDFLKVEQCGNVNSILRKDSKFFEYKAYNSATRDQVNALINALKKFLQQQPPTDYCIPKQTLLFRRKELDNNLRNFQSQARKKLLERAQFLVSLEDF
jgi:hypothetical protein